MKRNLLLITIFVLKKLYTFLINRCIMRNLLFLIIGMLVIGCSKNNEHEWWEEFTNGKENFVCLYANNYWLIQQ